MEKEEKGRAEKVLEENFPNLARHKSTWSKNGPTPKQDKPKDIHVIIVCWILSNVFSVSMIQSSDYMIIFLQSLNRVNYIDFFWTLDKCHPWSKLCLFMVCLFFYYVAKLYWLIFYQGFCFYVHEENKDLCNIFRYKEVCSKIYTKLNISTAINIFGTILEKMKGLQSVYLISRHISYSK